ncbi:hypothetical protein BT69DRAFT_663099 [Atractiella rhizophila]|nr:hypothetical protein BT69DRAFT_663099 [Atractiella rhizophila]
MLSVLRMSSLMQTMLLIPCKSAEDILLELFLQLRRLVHSTMDYLREEKAVVEDRRCGITMVPFLEPFVVVQIHLFAPSFP